MELQIKEVIAKFQAEISVLGSYLTKAGKIEVLERVNDFSIYRDETKGKKEEKKLPPVGSYERLMGLFGK